MVSCSGRLVISSFSQNAAEGTIPSSDDFADLGEEHVHGADGLAVLVLLHVEGLDVARIVGEDDRTLEVLLHQVVLCHRCRGA